MLSTKFLLPLLVLPGVRTEGEAIPKSTTNNCNAEKFTKPIFDGAEILSLSATLQTNYTTPASEILPPVTDLRFCEVNIHVRHHGANDDVLIRVWLPSERKDWNGRFQATGGGGFATSLGFVGLAPALKQGYAAVSTDGGHDEWSWLSLEWLMKPDRTIDWALWQNFAERSLVEQILIGKNIVEQYYGDKPHHSYWNGCSQGGRQGYLMAQKYPHLLDGIMAAAPALDLISITMGGFWPQLVMKDADTYMSNCEFGLFANKLIEGCDVLDGFVDGVIMEPDACPFEPETLIGHDFDCDGQTTQVTSSMASVVRKIIQGPHTPLGTQLGPGLSPGSNYAIIANISTTPSGTRTQNPIALPVLETLLLPPRFDLSTLTPIDYFALWAQASAHWSWALTTLSTDLTALRDAGTKLLSWHGMADEIIPYQHTLKYRQRIEREMSQVDDFYRLFLAPGVGHCAGGNGPLPTDPLATLVKWVEEGEAPEGLDAAVTNAQGDVVERQVCKWPNQAKYTGTGHAKRKENWKCVSGTSGDSKKHEDELRQKVMGLGSWMQSWGAWRV
ncbi:feruloyl esterase B precursor [Paraphoma chrysanthemicola]|nr:feruloyl esterase B precursor [Paraphoma chrysanthemicola]